MKNISQFIPLLLLASANAQISDTFPTLPYNDLQELHIELPYVKHYGDDSSLFVFGSNHTSRFEDPQINQIEQFIHVFNPTIILYEGDGISTEKSKRETVETYFEMGLAKYLADSLSIQSVNIEPDSKEKYNFLLEKYTLDDILLATLGLQITMMQINNDDFKKLFPAMIRDLVDEGLPLQKEHQSLVYFHKIYKRKFGQPFSYDNFDSKDIQAKYNRTIYNQINQDANTFRDQHIIMLTKKYMDNGEKVFLLVGGWHAIVCEPAFRLIAK